MHCVASEFVRVSQKSVAVVFAPFGGINSDILDQQMIISWDDLDQLDELSVPLQQVDQANFESAPVVGRHGQRRSCPINGTHLA